MVNTLLFRINKRYLFEGSKVFLREIKIPNTGSIARDHLANERTFLAWIRTSLALCGAGIALEALQFNTLSQYKNHIAAISCISIGGCFMFYATIRYIQVLRLLAKGQFKPNIFGISLTVCTVAIIVGGCWIFIHQETQDNFKDN